METREIHNKLEKQCASDYRINEIIAFSYPFRRIKINATVNRSPELSIQQIYSVLLRTILEGCSEERELVKFLGLHEEDFILRELYFLRERGYTNLTSGIWIVTGLGEEFIKDNSILKILEEEAFEFLLDSVNNEVLLKDFNLSSKPTSNQLEPVYDYRHKSAEMLEGKNQQLSDIYKQQNNGKAYLVGYDGSKILFDAKEFSENYLIEYIPRKGKDAEPYIEVRNADKEISLNRRLSKVLAGNYPSILYQFSNSERTVLAEIEEEESEVLEEFQSVEVLHKHTSTTEILSVWETQTKFKEALETAKKRLLIESPWIKRATLNYIHLIEKALKNRVQIIILYGIESNDLHHFGAVDKLRKLQEEHNDKFHLIHLPSHFEDNGNSKMTGTHRKLVIKDYEYFIQGSFNFLSFNKKEGQKVANEESVLINKGVVEKWKSVISEYGLGKNFMG